MVELLLENFRAILITGVLLVVGVGQFHREVGSILGLVFVGLMALMGSFVYAQGQTLGLGVIPISQPMFYGICCLLALFNIMSLRIAIAKRDQKRRRGY